MKILVINSGSSSLKYQLIDMNDESVICSGKYERIGYESVLTHKINGEKYVLEHPAKDHREALDFALQQLLNKEYPAIESLDEIGAIGHRAAHGGEEIKNPVIIDDEVIGIIEKYKVLAPLHNQAGIVGIKACQELMPGKPMVVVLDTAFHQTIPEERYIYPIPYEYYKKYSVRRYGFHGSSHYYVSRRIAELMNRDVNNLKTINCHLGQGAGITAIENGKSVDTSLGFGPMAGLPMCARSGDLDPSIITFLMEKENLLPKEMEDLLFNESGLYGVSGKISKDLRDIYDAYEKGDKSAKLAIEIYKYRVAQFIARYVVAMQGVDVITFTGGIGENQGDIRKGVCEYLKFLGVEVDDEQNNKHEDEIKISSKDSKIEVWVVATNEELVIARETLKLVGDK